MALFGETRRYPVNIEDVPQRLKQAFLAAEDARFYKHHGVDYKGIARAVWLLATTDDKRVPGGSTITQQVARQFFLSQEYSYKRKLAEMLLAMRIERELSKDEIFELYLNKSFFGHRSYGVGAAAEFYYGKKLERADAGRDGLARGDPEVPVHGNPLSNPGARQGTPRRLHPRAHGAAEVHHARPRPTRPRPRRCTPRRTSGRSRSMPPTWPRWSARKWSPAMAPRR